MPNPHWRTVSRARKGFRVGQHDATGVEVAMYDGYMPGAGSSASQVPVGAIQLKFSACGAAACSAASVWALQHHQLHLESSAWAFFVGCCMIHTMSRNGHFQAP